MSIYSFLLFHCYYFFKKQGRFRPLELSSFFLVFLVAPPVFSVLIFIQKKFNLFQPMIGLVLAVVLLLAFFFIQKIFLINHAFKEGKTKYGKLDDKSIRYLGFVLFGTMIVLSIIGLMLVISSIRH